MMPVPIVAFLLAFLSTLAVHSPAVAAAPLKGMLQTNGVLEVGRPAPDFFVTDIHGKPVSLGSLKGRPALIDFSSIFCKSCQDTIVEFQRFREAYKEEDLALVIFVDDEAAPKVVERFFKEVGATYTVVRDVESRTFKTFGVSVIPFQVLIDRDGVVKAIHAGYDPELEKTFELRSLK